jgi:hypothetical protein
MKFKRFTIFLALGILFVPSLLAQTRKPLTNADIVNMTKQGFEPALIVKAVETSETEFDASAEGLVALKDAGVNQSVMEAMLSAQASKPSGSQDAVQGRMSGAVDDSKTGSSNGTCSASNGCLVREGTEVSLAFANDLNSKTAADGDPVEFLLDGDLKVGEAIVVPKGAHAKATVSNAKRAGMMGKPGELSVQMQYLVVGDNHVRIRGTKGREGESKTGAAVALTVLFGPIGLIKHGKNVDIPAGTPLVAYVDQDI